MRGTGDDTPGDSSGAHPALDDDLAGLVGAYRRGWFPMADPRDGALRWFSPNPRAVINIVGGEEPAFHVPRSLTRTLRRGSLTFTSDAAFDKVIGGCAAPAPGREDTWIDGRIAWAFRRLHAAGLAHSIEAWRVDGGSRRLVGGIYGLALGGAFFAESMFSRPDEGGTDASKACLVKLVEHLRRRGFMLLDVQFTNELLGRFGVAEVPRQEYLRRLGAAAAATAATAGWEPFGE